MKKLFVGIFLAVFIIAMGIGYLMPVEKAFASHCNGVYCTTDAQCENVCGGPGLGFCMLSHGVRCCVCTP